jgi:hypothetical protein
MAIGINGMENDIIEEASLSCPLTRHLFQGGAAKAAGLSADQQRQEVVRTDLPFKKAACGPVDAGLLASLINVIVGLALLDPIWKAHVDHGAADNIKKVLRRGGLASPLGIHFRQLFDPAWFA